MIAKNEAASMEEPEACLVIGEKQKMQGQAHRIFLNLVQVDRLTSEKTEVYLTDFGMDEKKDIPGWLMEPCRRRALRSTRTLKIDRDLMLDSYRELFQNVIVV